MDILFLLVPLSVVLGFLVMGIFAWALHAGQFDDLEGEGDRIFATADVPMDPDLDRDQADA
jgi:cbb3-type cytochrome oxidase maturation protein